jgi:hypothetical protein
MHMDAYAQAEMQERVRMLVQGCHIYIPKAWKESARTYLMEAIDTQRPIALPATTHPYSQDISAWVRSCQRIGVVPLDFEAYEQPDGRVAIVDVDKFGQITHDGTVALPWGDRQPLPHVLRNFPSTWIQ